MNNTPLSMPNLEQLKEAQVRVNNSPHVRRTPLLNNIDVPKEGASSQCFLKLESLQKTGSFKIRGMVNLFAAHEKAIRENGAVTMSAGNAGKAFAFLAGQLQIPAATVCMPNTVPADRVKSIEALGANVVLTTNEGLFPKVEEYVGQGRILAHPFDSHELMAGHASVGLEILEDCPDADIIAVCCGGGGLVGGVAAAVKLSGSKAKIFAVEPTGAPCLFNSMKEGKAANISPHTIAHGLAPPFAGQLCYEYAKEFVDDVVLVTDDELVEATRFAYSNGILAETSGCAGIAALMFGKLGDTKGKKVVCVVSGSNISPEDLQEALAGNAKFH
ncbi:hypothetical protein ScalyP_jg9987 [Parmales sp. scaly parma]|nr:hypothetical protein ScalyP_jg9987 [Parmales sp. scaly parma]